MRDKFSEKYHSPKWKEEKMKSQEKNDVFFVCRQGE
jgi:hypothetical protein